MSRRNGPESSSYTEHNLAACISQKQRKILKDILYFRCIQNLTITMNNSQKALQ